MDLQTQNPNQQNYPTFSSRYGSGVQSPDPQQSLPNSQNMGLQYPQPQQPQSQLPLDNPWTSLNPANKPQSTQPQPNDLSQIFGTL